jgi:hypothetical protein
MDEQVFMEVVTAKSAYGYSALKSMPVTDETSESGSVGSIVDMELPRALREQCASLMKGRWTAAGRTGARGCER